MSTRGLLIVKNKEGKVKVAEYIPCDAYPGNPGAGYRLFEKCNQSGFLDELESCLDNLELIKGIEDGEDRKYRGINIFDYIINKKDSNKKLFLKDLLSFGEDSLFCEWAYMIDYKERKFVVFNGFNKDYEKQDDMFKIEKDQVEPDFPYYGIERILELDLNNVKPTEKEFLEMIENA